MLINAFGLSSIKPSAHAKKLACITGKSVEQTTQFFVGIYVSVIGIVLFFSVNHRVYFTKK